MITAHTAKYTRVYLDILPDCGENEGGYYVEIYLKPEGDRYDDFCIHPDDCDCNNWNEVVDYARYVISTIICY